MKKQRQVEQEQQEGEEVFDPFGLRKNKVVQDPPKQDDVKDEQIDKDAFYERFKSYDTESFKSLEELINQQEGEDKIATFVSNAKGAQETLKSLKEKEEEREQYFQKVRITDSRLYQEKFQKPLLKSLDLYNGILGENDSEGKPKNDGMWEALRTTIYNEGKEVSTAEIRKMLSDFNKQYAQKFGEEPDLPTIKEVLDAREDLIRNRSRAAQAIQEWQKEVEDEERESASANIKKTTQQREILTEQRNGEFKSFLGSLNLDQYGGFFDQEAVKDAATEIHNRVLGVVKGESADTMQYPEYLDLYVKAKLFDKLMPEAAKMKKFMDEYKSGNPGSIKTPGLKVEEGERKTDDGGESLGSFLNVIPMKKTGTK